MFSNKHLWLLCPLHIFRVEGYHIETDLQISISNFQAVHKNIWSPQGGGSFRGTGCSSYERVTGSEGVKDGV